MKSNPGPILDMTPSGEFSGPPKPKVIEVLVRLVAALLLIGVAVVAFWLALFLVPFLVLGALALYALYWWRHPSTHWRHVVIRTRYRR